MPKRVVPLPPVTGRLEITSIADYVDETIERMGSGKIDLTDPRQREVFHNWLESVLRMFLMRLGDDLTKGADRGIRQILALVEDPDYYAKASERRAQRRRTLQRQQEESDRDTKLWIAQHQAEEDAFKAALDNGHVRVFPGARPDLPV